MSPSGYIHVLDDKVNVTAKWVGTSGQGDWEVSKSF